MGTLPILLFFIGSTNLTGIVVNLLVVPLVPVITIGGFVSLVLANLTGWSFWTVPIERLLKLVFGMSQLAEDFAMRIVVENMVMRRAIMLVLLGILGCILAIVRDEKQKIAKEC